MIRKLSKMYEKSDSSWSSRRPRNRRPTAISSVLSGVFSSLGLTEQYNGWQVVEHWPELVGEAIARVSTALKFEDGVLYVAVNDAAWRQELAMKQESLLDKIKSLPYGRAVKQIRLVRGEKGK